MELFGSSDDDDDQPTESADGTTTESGERTATGSGDGPGSERIDGSPTDVIALAERIREGSGDARADRLAEAVSRLHGPDRERVPAARALARVARDDPDALEPEIDRVIDRLADGDLARPIAESLLGSAHDLHRQGVGYHTVAAGAVDALTEAHARIGDALPGGDAVPGGGASEVALGTELREYANTVGGSEMLAVEAAADAVDAVPAALAGRTTVDPIDAQVEMRSEYSMDGFVGIDARNGELRDATDPSLAVERSELRRRVTDGIALGVVVCRTRGTASQLETLTGHRPYPE